MTRFAGGEDLSGRTEQPSGNRPEGPRAQLGRRERESPGGQRLTPRPGTPGPSHLAPRPEGPPAAPGETPSFWTRQGPGPGSHKAKDAGPAWRTLTGGPCCRPASPSSQGEPSCLRFTAGGWDLAWAAAQPAHTGPFCSASEPAPRWGHTPPREAPPQACGASCWGWMREPIKGLRITPGRRPRQWPLLVV